MRYRAALASVGLAVMVWAVTSASALAFHHHRGVGCYPPCGGCGTYYGGYSSWCYGGCGGYGYGSCGYGGCGSSGCGNGGCGSCGSACGSCATGGCRTCHLGHKLHRICAGMACLKHSCRSRCGSCCGSACCSSCYSSCGGCDSGCSSGCGGCSSGGCSSGGCGAETIINDGPAPAQTTPAANKSTIIEQPGLPAIEASRRGSSPLDQSADKAREFHLVASASIARQNGSVAFEKGLNAYRQHSLTDAAVSFNSAAEAEPENALYHYYHALATYELAGADAATDSLEKAVQTELQGPVKDWGRRMERVQGRGRVWIEKARRDAGLVR